MTPFFNFILVSIDYKYSQYYYTNLPLKSANSISSSFVYVSVQLPTVLVLNVFPCDPYLLYDVTYDSMPSPLIELNKYLTFLQFNGLPVVYALKFTLYDFPSHVH